MAIKKIRIGSMVDIHQYDDAVHGSAFETDGVLVGGDSGNITVLTALQAGGGGAIGIQYKTRLLTITDGFIDTIGAESGWNSI